MEDLGPRIRGLWVYSKGGVASDPSILGIFLPSKFQSEFQHVFLSKFNGFFMDFGAQNGMKIT